MLGILVSLNKDQNDNDLCINQITEESRGGKVDLILVAKQQSRGSALRGNHQLWTGGWKLCMAVLFFLISHVGPLDRLSH